MKSNWGGKGAERLQDLKQPVDIPDQIPKEGRDDAHEKHPTFSVRLEWMSRNGYSMLYGSLLGGILYDPSHGIQFVFEGAYAEKWNGWEFAVWMVSITGGGLESIWHHLSGSREAFVQEAEGREIKVVPYTLKGYSPAPKGKP